jgi:hypothetical protein
LQGSNNLYARKQGFDVVHGQRQFLVDKAIDLNRKCDLVQSLDATMVSAIYELCRSVVMLDETSEIRFGVERFHASYGELVALCRSWLLSLS